MPDPASTAVAVPITVTFTDALGGTGTFDGTMMIQRVVKSGGGLAAVGTVTGTATDSTGAGVGTVTNRAVTVPLQATRTCDILHLTLGPLDLTLLGLVVHLDQVVLDITAEQAPGISWATCCARRRRARSAHGRRRPRWPAERHRRTAESDPRRARLRPNRPGFSRGRAAAPHVSWRSASRWAV